MTLVFRPFIGIPPVALVFPLFTLRLAQSEYKLSFSACIFRLERLLVRMARSSAYAAPLSEWRMRLSGRFRSDEA